MQKILLSIKGAEATYLTDDKYHYHGFPRDAVHLACAAHKTRLQNSLRVPGINIIEKATITQRIANMATIHVVAGYSSQKMIEYYRHDETVVDFKAFREKQDRAVGM